jgi:transcription initiation factor IIE alpha subunit
MTSQKTDPIKTHETIIVNICEVCNSRYSLEEAQKMQMTCCGKPLTQKEERVSMPVGP